MTKRLLYAMALAVALAGMTTACGALGPSEPDVTVIVGDSNSAGNDTTTTDDDTTSTETKTETAQ